MPSTFLGLILYTAFLLPGYVSYVRRRSLQQVAKLSPVVETISLVGVSAIANGVSLAAFALLRWARPENTPDVGALVRSGGGYAEHRPAYLALWGGGLLAVSCLLAFFAPQVTKLARVRRALNPIIVDVSAWYHVFEDEPELAEGQAAYPFVTCTLADGTTIGGRLSWYSTEVEEIADRDLALADPSFVQGSDGTDLGRPGAVIVLSAREIRWMSVTWVLETAGGSEQQPSASPLGRPTRTQGLLMRPRARSGWLQTSA